MAVNMGSSSTMQGAVSNSRQPETAVAEILKEGSTEVNLSKLNETHQEYSLQNSKTKYEMEIRKSGIIDQLTSTIDINNTTTIIEFGKEPAQRMSNVADQVLSKYNSTVVDETSQLVDALLGVMKKIDIDEVKSLQELSEDKKKKKGLFAKFKESAQDKLDRLVGKYKGVGYELEQICEKLSIYEQQIKQSNADINRMYEAAKDEYKELVAVIMAADQACKEIEEYRDSKQREFDETGDTNLQFEIQNINQALTLMEQRASDLRCSEAVALQSVPTFKVQEYTNSNLARKISSSMIVTVPAFKSALVNSIIAKQQAIQMQGLAALDEATALLIRKNADNAVTQLQNSQKLASTSALKADDIEYAWNTIMNGIQQYKEMEKQYRDIRIEEAKRIEEANDKYMASLMIR